MITCKCTDSLYLCTYFYLCFIFCKCLSWTIIATVMIILSKVMEQRHNILLPAWQTVCISLVHRSFVRCKNGVVVIAEEFHIIIHTTFFIVSLYRVVEYLVLVNLIDLCCRILVLGNACPVHHIIIKAFTKFKECLFGILICRRLKIFQNAINTLYRSLDKMVYSIRTAITLYILILNFWYRLKSVYLGTRSNSLVVHVH